MPFPRCDLSDLEGLLWTHVSLLSLAGILILASFNANFTSPAPYGRHADPVKAKAWGFAIPQRIGHIVSDAIPGLPLCLSVYLLYTGMLPPGGGFSEVRAINVILLCGWLLHYLYRGIVHPLIMPYSAKTVAVGITLGGLLPNTVFSYLIAAQLACTEYPHDWASQPRFIIGVVLYVTGTAINRWADLKLRAGRLARGYGAAAGPGSVGSGGGGGGGADRTATSATCEGLLAARSGDAASDSSPGPASGESGPGAAAHSPSADVQVQKQAAVGAAAAAAVRSYYFIPRGGLYEFITCPNYAGELMEWIGYALAVWSWPALGWVLFCASTFIPRSLTHHKWYKEQFGKEYPPNRKALIPFLF